MRIFNSKCKSVLRERSTRNSFLWIRFKILLADLYIDKNYYIDIFHIEDYLNKQLMGSSENQFLMLHAKLMVIFLFLLKGSFAVLVTVAVSYSRRMNSADLTFFTRPDLSDNFLSNNKLTSWEVNLRAIIQLEILFRKRNYRLEYGRTLNTNEWANRYFDISDENKFLAFASLDHSIVWELIDLNIYLSSPFPVF